VLVEIDDATARRQRPGEEKPFLKLGIAYRKERRVGTQEL
jgi:hypothetical protein